MDMGFSALEIRDGSLLFLEKFETTAGDDLTTLIGDTDRSVWADGGTTDPAAWFNWIRCLWLMKGISSVWKGGQKVEVQTDTGDLAVLEWLPCRNTDWPPGYDAVAVGRPFTELSGFEMFVSALREFDSRGTAGGIKQFRSNLSDSGWPSVHL
ncbi:hypothetical protein [Subtercola endophyticus]|uniref:hypothetical protein n=1 Tax=Subtercola endophyticus TaxID=2895559 RepID=UPI001E5D191B|nr:hypothetical protein [Subtercola endophyticus]UFS58286.1 hypothetical protein LQ955_14885 [Subtercola endophyticus]